MGQQRHEIEFSVPRTHELQLPALGIEAPDAGLPGSEVKRAVRETQLRQLERGLRAAGQHQVSERKGSLRELQLEVGAGLLGGHLQLQPHFARVQLERRFGRFVHRADRHLIEQHLLDRQLPVVDSHRGSRPRGRRRTRAGDHEIRQVQFAPGVAFDTELAAVGAYLAHRHLPACQIGVDAVDVQARQRGEGIGNALARQRQVAQRHLGAFQAGFKLAVRVGQAVRQGGGKLPGCHPCTGVRLEINRQLRQ